MVIFDSHEIRYENTGIHHFIKNLVASLVKLSESEDIEIAFFLRKKHIHLLPETEDRKAELVLYRSLYKYVFPYWKFWKGVWHTPFQYPRLMPRRGNVLLTVHDLNFLYDTSGEEQARLRKIVQTNIDNASELTTISEYAKNDILNNMDTKGKKINVIYNGCQEYRGEILRPADVPDAPFLYTIGPTIPKKNFQVLPCLLKNNGLHLVISGIISQPYLDTIINEAKQFGVVEKVHFTGIVSEPEKHWYLKNCTAFVFPSLAEGFGIPVIEAMYYGKPVFLSRHTSLPEIGKDKAFYFNENFDREMMQAEFEDGMSRYLSGEMPAERIITHAKSFSWDKAAEEYIRIYKSML